MSRAWVTPIQFPRLRASGTLSRRAASPGRTRVPAKSRKSQRQCHHMFANLRTILAAAGATPEDVIRVTVWIKRPEIRAEVNKEWVEMFPDPHSRPARHTMFYDHFAGEMVVQCEAWAVIGAE